MSESRKTQVEKGFGIGAGYTSRQLTVRGRRSSGNRDNGIRGNQLSTRASGCPPTQLFPNCANVRSLRPASRTYPCGNGTLRSSRVNFVQICVRSTRVWRQLFTAHVIGIPFETCFVRKSYTEDRLLLCTRNLVEKKKYPNRERF